MKRPYSHLLVPLAVLLLGACGVTRPEAPADVRRELVGRGGDRPETAILFVGNSYSMGVPKALKKLAAARGERVRVEQATHGGWSLSRHAADAETLRRIRGRRWDVVVLQEQSRVPSRPFARTVAMLPAVRKLAGEVRERGGIPLLYQTWGYRDGDPWKPGDDFHAMTARVRDGYQAASGNAGGLAVAPVGDAWEREVSAGRGTRLFQEDGSHPTARGNRLTAGVFYQTIFGR